MFWFQDYVVLEYICYLGVYRRKVYLEETFKLFTCLVGSLIEVEKKEMK